MKNPSGEVITHSLTRTKSSSNTHRTKMLNNFSRVKLKVSRSSVTTRRQTLRKTKSSENIKKPITAKELKILIEKYRKQTQQQDNENSSINKHRRSQSLEQ